MTQEQDSWQTEDLVPFNSGDVTVADAYWEDGRYGTQIALVYKVDVPNDPVDYPAETTIAWYSCGKGWTPIDAGARVVKPEADPSRPAKIHSSSNYGRLMNRVVKDLGFNMGGRGLPTEAKVWVGLRFHLNREIVKYEGLPAREGETGLQNREGSILLPLTILPQVFTSSPITAQPAVAPASTATTMPIGGSPEEYLLSVIVGKSSIQEAKVAAVRDQRISADQALQARILENQLIEQWMAGGVIGIVDGRITKL